MEEVVSSGLSLDEFSMIGMTFASCLDALLFHKKCSRMAWQDGSYITIENEKLMIFVPDDLKLHPLIVSTGDITATDWVIMKGKDWIIEDGKVSES